MFKKKTSTTEHYQAKHRERPALGALMMVMASSVLPIMDSIVKVMSETMPFQQMVFLRYLSMTLVLFPLILFRSSKGSFRTRHPRLQLLRGLLMFLATFCFFRAISQMPLANAVALAFITPFLITILSAIILKEKVGIHRYFATALGFVGVLIIVQPGSPSFSSAAVYALLCGLFWAFFAVTTRALATGTDPFISLFYTGLVGSVLGAFFIPFYWVPIDLPTIGIFIIIGTLGMVGHIFLILAFYHGEASFIASFMYFELLSATIFGFIVFGDFPSPVVWLGMSIIVASGLYINHREGKKPSDREKRLS